MPKYHIAEDVVTACRVRNRPCVKSSVENHFDSREEAEDVFLNLNKSGANMSELIDPLLEPIVITVSPNATSVAELISEITQFAEYPSKAVIEFYEKIFRGQIPDFLPVEVKHSYSMNSDFRSSMTSATLNFALQSCGMFGKITKETASDIAEIVGDGILLDPMAGNGFAAKALREAGVRTVASDNHSWEISSGIENLDALESLKKYGEKISHLLISWAPYTSNIDVQLLREIRKNYPHITIINIGESRGGCTGSDEFWDEADIVTDQPHVRYSTTSGLHDQIVFVK
jgi:hypothetical protein